MSGEPVEDAWLTIDELARETGVTVRNLRAYQARGLLPPPEVRARTGYYGPEHQARLELIKDLQAQGVKLETIKKLFAATDGSTDQVLTFIRTLRELFGEQERTIVSRSELAERFGTDDAALLKRALRLGLLLQVAEDQYEEVLPQLSLVGQSLVGLGIPLERSLEVVAQLRRHAEGIAKIYVEVFLDEVWEPFDASGRPDDEWPRLHETIEQLQTISGEALLAVLGLAVSERLDQTFGKEIARTVRTARDDGRSSASKA
jgi:DNA-binding transcriptional MerR regulator